MRSEIDIQKAHDMLVSVILDPHLMGLLRMTAADQQRLGTLAGVLCWVLQHDHVTAFAAIITGLEEALRMFGLAPVEINCPPDEKERIH